MNMQTLLAGALQLRTETFVTLRQRSDVFERGLILMLLIALLVGIFDAAVPVVTRAVQPVNEAQQIEDAVRGFEQSFTGPSTYKPIVAAYIRESAGMIYELKQLPPNAGAAFSSLARILNWLGEVLARPFSFPVLGSLLLAGLFVHLTSRWLGGHAGIAQMLGLGALSYAPQILLPLSSLFALAGNLMHTDAFGTANILLGLLIFVWSTVIYIKATAVAQEFTYGRALGAILLALGLFLLVALLLACMVGGVIAGLVGLLLPAAR